MDESSTGTIPQGNSTGGTNPANQAGQGLNGQTLGQQLEQLDGTQARQQLEGQAQTEQDKRLAEADLDRVVYMADGTEVTVRELKQGYLRQDHFTKKTQRVAQREQQVEQAYNDALAKHQELQTYQKEIVGRFNEVEEMKKAIMAGQLPVEPQYDAYGNPVQHPQLNWQDPRMATLNKELNELKGMFANTQRMLQETAKQQQQSVVNQQKRVETDRTLAKIAQQYPNLDQEDLISKAYILAEQQSEFTLDELAYEMNERQKQRDRAVIERYNKTNLEQARQGRKSFGLTGAGNPVAGTAKPYHTMSPEDKKEYLTSILQQGG